MAFPRQSRAYSRHANTTTLQRVKAWKQEAQSIIRGQAVFRIVGDLQDRLGFNEASEWMNTPRKELDNRSPLEAILAGEETKVEEVVDRLRSVMSPL
jgi:uncharacterized protein (DUF2384 family)